MTEGESKDPEGVSSAMPRQGILSITLVLPSFSYKFWVYIMASSTGTLYIGVTGFFDSRISQHKWGAVEGFAKKYSCDRLVYYEIYDDAGKALGREKQLKGWRREKKIALIEKMNPRWKDLAEHLGSEVLFPGQSIKKTP